MDPVLRQRKIRNYKNGIFTLWLFAALSIINVFTITYTGNYFLLSSYLLSLVVFVLKDLTEVYVSLIVAVIFMAPCIVCAIFSRKRYGFLIAGLVIVSLDTLLLVSDVIATFTYDTLKYYIFDVVLHIAAIAELSIAIKDREAVKLMKVGFNENDRIPDSVTHKVLPSGEIVLVLDDTDIETDDRVSDAINNGNSEFGEKDKKRLITITRPKTFFVLFVKFEVVIDGVVVGTLKNGGLLKIMLSTEAHALYVQFAKGNSDMLQITSGEQDKNYSIKPVQRAMDMYIEIYEI